MPSSGGVQSDLWCRPTTETFWHYQCLLSSCRNFGNFLKSYTILYSCLLYTSPVTFVCLPIYLTAYSFVLSVCDMSHTLKLWILLFFKQNLPQKCLMRDKNVISGSKLWKIANIRVMYPMKKYFNRNLTSPTVIIF